LVVTYSETDRVKFEDARLYAIKLHFQANLGEGFAEDKKHHYCRDLFFGWAILQKAVFSH